jgi:hypothetical protein
LPWQYQIDTDGLTADISDDDEFDAIRAAFFTWEDAPFTGADFTEGNQYDPGDTWQSYATYDDHNSVGWVPSFLNPPGMEDAYAIGATWSDRSVGRVLETNIAMNDYYTWTLDAEATWWDGNDYDAQSTLTHEVGHVLGLFDVTGSGLTGQTMYAAGTHDNSQRSLEWGDINGVHYLYPEHDDGDSGADGSDSFGEANEIQRNQWYSGCLCHTEGDIDTQDYYKFYATAGMEITAMVWPIPGVNIDLELYNPSGSLVAYSRTTSYESIVREIETSGYWAIRIYTDGVVYTESIYPFRVVESSKYASDYMFAGGLSGAGGAINPGDGLGSSPDGNYAGIYGYNQGDAAAITFYLNDQVTGNSNIYIYGTGITGYNAHIFVYVSNNNIDWTAVGYGQIDGGPTTVQIGTATITYRYVGISIYIDSGPAALAIDCVIVTT